MPRPGWLAIRGFADLVNLELAAVFVGRKAGILNYPNQINHAGSLSAAKPNLSF
jgi:hypothetical protein